MEKFKITGYDVTKSILTYSAHNPEVDSGHIAIFIYIGEMSNECNWNPRVELSRKKIHLITGVRTDETYLKKIKQLEDWGAIKIISYSKNQFQPYDIIEINTGFLKNQKSLLNHNEIDANTLLDRPEDIYIKTIELENQKNRNSLLRFFNKKELFKYQILDENRKDIFNRNLKHLISLNFDLWTKKDISNEEHPSKLGIRKDCDFHAYEKKVVNNILNYFGLKELKNNLLLDNVNQFVKFLSESNDLEFFDHNFSYYKEFKKISGEHSHRNLEVFLGKPKNNYEDGAWKSDDFRKRLELYKIKHGQKGKNGKPDLSGAKLRIIKKLHGDENVD